MSRHNSVLSRKSRQDTDMRINEHSQALVPVTDQKKRTHQWWLVGARVKIIQRQRAVRCLTSYTVSPDSMEQVTRHHHYGNKHEPPYGRLTMLFVTSMHIYHTGEVSPSPASFLNLHLHDMLTRALYSKYRYRYRYLPVDKIPIFSFCITAT